MGGGGGMKRWRIGADAQKVGGGDGGGGGDKVGWRKSTWKDIKEIREGRNMGGGGEEGGGGERGVKYPSEGKGKWGT